MDKKLEVLKRTKQSRRHQKKVRKRMEQLGVESDSVSYCETTDRPGTSAESQNQNQQYHTHEDEEMFEQGHPLEYEQDMSEHHNGSSTEEDWIGDPISEPSGSSESSDSDTDFETEDTPNDLLRAWSINHNISNNALKSLLAILNKIKDKPDTWNFPKDPRTFKNTPRQVKDDIVSMGNGQFWYYGLKKSLINIIKKYNIELRSIELMFNIDGLPLYRSSKAQFWPILCKIYDLDVDPMVIAIYYGHTKPPSAQEFLNKFIEELSDLCENGFEIDNHHIEIRIRCFICDTPARSFIKGTIGFNGYYSCLKCTIKGTRHKDKMCFPTIDDPERTDDSFRRKLDWDHHKFDTPLEVLPIDMVKDIIVADSLHLVDLGNTKKLLTAWVQGAFNYETKLSFRQITEVSNFLTSSKLPAEIHRKMRSLDTLSFWKGVEFRSFLLYLSPVILKDYLPCNVFEHFKLYFCSIFICSCAEFLNHLDVADQMLKTFVSDFGEIYGMENISSNVHNLCHLVSDVKHLGILPLISAYPFENFLYLLKRLLKSGHKPLEQAAKRLTEIFEFKRPAEKLDYPV